MSTWRNFRAAEKKAKFKSSVGKLAVMLLEATLCVLVGKLMSETTVMTENTNLPFLT